MPNMDNGRQKVLDYLKENNLTIATLAVQYSMARQDVTNILNGKLKNPQAHRFVARVIEDFKIRQKGKFIVVHIEIENLSDFIESAKEVVKKAEELEVSVQQLNEMELELKTKTANK